MQMEVPNNPKVLSLKAMLSGVREKAVITCQAGAEEMNELNK